MNGTSGERCWAIFKADNPSKPGESVLCQDYFKVAFVQSGEEISLGFNPPYLAGDSIGR